MKLITISCEYGSGENFPQEITSMIRGTGGGRKQTRGISAGSPWDKHGVYRLAINTTRWNLKQQHRRLRTSPPAGLRGPNHE